MKLGILLQHYFPYGGLQRDAARLARASDNATLVVSTADSPPDGISLLRLNSGGTANHQKLARFAHDCRALEQFDQAIAFSRVPGSPFHFCGDPCFLAKFRRTKPALARFLPRYRTLLSIENAIFEPDSDTHIFFLSPSGPAEFIKEYGLQKDRYTVLPPWLDKPDGVSKVEIREEFQIPSSSPIALFAGSNFSHKRLDLAIEATGQADAHLIVCGNDDPSPNMKQPHVHFAGARDDIPRLMRGANVLLHPSKHETAGMVLTEALVHHLPVICTDSCGYSPYVKEAGSIVLSSNPTAETISDSLKKILSDEEVFRSAASNWAKDESRYRTADIMLEKMARP